jgi:outer membrane protein OmpA-like peptidoglycan-associated protein
MDRNRALRTVLIRATLASLLLGSAAFATSLPAADTFPGAKDHPLLSRYAGSRLVGWLTKAYDETDLVAGPYKDNDAKAPKFAKLVHVEGRITRIAYNYAPDRSSLEVMRNYRNGMQAAGMSVLFSCDKDTCSDRGGWNFGREMLDRKLDDSAIAFKPDLNPSAPFNYGSGEPRYTLASSTRADGKVTYAAVYVVPPADGQNGGVLVEIVEPEAMEGGKVAVNLNAEQMGKGLAAEGRIALYGLYFDTDRSELRADSKPTLDEMAKLLRQDPKLGVYIVGHTDNQGAYAHNLELSQKRAEAVVAALVAGYKVDPKRLIPKGVASVAPVASNDAEPGRAKNRRVELVKQ